LFRIASFLNVSAPRSSSELKHSE